MDLNFLRHDLLTTASTSRFCLRVLPPGKKAKQKIVVGDSAGTLQAVSLGKSNELVPSFRMNVAPPGQPNKPVSYIDLSGDKIFVAAGEAINGVTRKGKGFYRLSTLLSESINSMVVRTPLIWTTSEYVLNVFEDGKEAHFYMSPDKVNHLTVENVSSDTALDSIIACNDRMVRVVKNSDLGSEHAVEGAAKTVAIYTTKNSQHKDVVYGTDNGYLGSFRISPQGLQKRWYKQDAKNTGGLNCILAADFTKDGVSDLIVGRDNGFLEIFNFQGGATEPTLIYQTNLNEAITGMDLGMITNTAQEDIAVSTYSGKILCFSNYVPQAPLSPAVQSSATTAAAAKQAELIRKRNEKKIQAVQQDIEKLREKFERKKAEYSSMSESHIAVSVDYKVRDKFVLDPSACWILTIELDCPIESIALQCDIDIELMDVEGNGAIVSKSKPEQDSKTKLLATYRNTESINRLEMKVRTVEGQYGTLQVFVIPKLSPKTAQLAQYQIRPLSLHQRLSEKPARLEALTLNTLSIQGGFSLSDILSWVGQCIPDVPEKAPGDELTLYFQSTFQETLLSVRLKAGEAVFKSDNISTLAILKDFITRQATNRKMQVKSPFEIRDETCAHVLQLLHPRLEYQLGLSEKVKLIEALKEVAMQEQDVSFMSEQYKEIIDKAKAIESEFALQPRRLEFLHGIVKNLYIDKYKFKGQNVAAKLPILQGLLEKYTLKEVQAFFAQS